MNQTLTTTVVAVQKEEIPYLNFPCTEVLNDQSQINQRRLALERGIRLGNGHRRKVKIFFHDDEGIKVVETTIWALTQNYIVLKRGVTIPVYRILEVKAY